MTDTIKTTSQLNGSITTTTVKAGYKTTEFWLTLLAQGLGYATTLGLIPSDSIWEKVAGFLVAGLAHLGYSIARGNAKK